MPCDYNELPHNGIRTLSPYVPGKSADELARERGFTKIIKLASNENPLGCSRRVIEGLANLDERQIANYPMSSNHPFREKLASKLGVDAQMLTLGNGSDSLFCLLLTCFALHTHKHILTHNLAFSSYAIQAKTLGIPVVSTPVDDNWLVNIDALIAATNDQTALIFIANPNNPTGQFVSKTDIQRLLESIPITTLLVLDEAYYEYLDPADQLYALELLNKHQNLVITRTFSKAYGLAGLRLGYAIANPQITALLYRIQLPFVVNIAALTAANAALDDTDFVEQTIHLNTQGLTQMRNGLIAMGISLLPSNGNFVTFSCGCDSMPIYQGLLDYGIIVRPLHPYGLNHYLRVTIGTIEQNTQFLDVLSNQLKRLHDEK